MNTYDEILKNFPEGMEPRDIQKDIFKQIAKALDNGSKYILLDAGTGIGKSVIAITLANYFESAYIVTVTKQLQDQYAEDFPISVIKGKSNFVCKTQMKRGEYLNCDEGYCQMVEDKKYKCPYGVGVRDILTPAFVDAHGNEWGWNGSERCAYWEQKVDAIKSNITLMNYASFYPEMNFVPFFDNRALGIFDEAHNLEDQIMGQISVLLSNNLLARDFGRIPDKFDIIIPQIPSFMFESEAVNEWAIEIKKIMERCEQVTTTEDMPKKIKTKFTSMLQRLEKAHHEIIMHPDEWVIDNNKDMEKTSIKPIDVSRYCKRYFFDHVDVVLLMSATIFQKESFCRWHGLDEKEVTYINVKSPFPKKNRPIYLKPVGKMSYKFKAETKPKMILVIKEILEKHNTEKGVIHTHNHEIALYLKEYLGDPRIMIYSNDYSKKMNFRDRLKRDDIIDEFIKSEEPKVLVAPSVDEGVDLPGDLCTFQIIAKIPYPDLSDKQIKARMKKDKDWYAYKTVTSMVQAYGRGMRKSDDYCDTYILDGDITSVLKDKWRRCIDFLPEYFLEAVQRKRTINAEPMSKVLQIKTPGQQTFKM